MQRIVSESLAYHEAAHAVMARCCRCFVASATIMPGTGYAGRIQHHNPSRFMTHEKRLRDTTRVFQHRSEVAAMIALAGPIAECIHAGRFSQAFKLPALLDRHGRDDVRTATITLSYVCRQGARSREQRPLEKHLTAIQQRVCRLLRRRHSWRTVVNIARLLLKHGTLNAEQLRYLTRNCIPYHRIC